MISIIKNTITDLLAFLRNPKDEPSQIQSKSEKTKKLFLLLLIDIPIMGVLLAVINGLQKIGLFNADSNKILELMHTLPAWSLIVSFVFIVPFFEELVFRLFLRYKRNYIFHLVIWLVSLTGKRNREKVEACFTNFWIKKYWIVFYSSAILFGLMHLTNYKFSWVIILFSPIIIAPQFVVGAFFGYLRVRYGFIWGYYMHAIHNLIFLGIPLLFMPDSVEKINIEKENFSLKIEETYKKPNDSPVFNLYSKDSFALENVTLKGTLSFFLSKDEILIKSNNDVKLNKMINVYANKKLNDSTDFEKIVIEQLVKLYDFKVIKEIVPSEAWDLVVVDSTLLTRYISDTVSIKGTLSNSNKEVSIKNLGIDYLAIGISRGCNKLITNKTKLKARYNIKVPIDDFERLKTELLSNYGISLVQSQLMLEYTTVEFKK